MPDVYSERARQRRYRMQQIHELILRRARWRTAWWLWRLLSPFLRWKARRDYGYAPWDTTHGCRHCAYLFDWGVDAFYRLDKEGTDYIPGDPTWVWWRGVQYCPRCLRNWPYDDDTR